MRSRPRAEDGVRDLFNGLIESGFCMLDFGETRPASGYEHHISHFWEMKLLREGRHTVLHGAKVGVAVRISAQRYDMIRAMSRAEAADRLAAFTPPTHVAQEQVIRDAYGPIADQIIPIQAPFLALTATDYRRLAENIVANWDAIQRIAATVPPDSEIEGLAAPRRRSGGGRGDRPERRRNRPGHRVRALLPQPVQRRQVELDVGDRRGVG